LGGREIDVEDWQEEELGGGQTEPMRSQVREESSGEGSGGVLNFEGGCHWQGRFERCYKIGAGRVESRERKAWTYGISDHLPLRWQKLSRSRSV
jgi:hypothetical protein